MAALALPGMVAKSHADSPPAMPQIDTNFSRYEESGNRMRIETYQAAASLAVGDNLGFRVNGVKDVVTGASPVTIGRPGPSCKGPSNGLLVQCMSGASIRDERDAVDIGANYYLKDVTLGVDVGRSSENDYTSDFFNVDTRWELNQKMTTLATGFGYASDSVWAIQHVNGQNVREPGVGGDKSTHQGLLGITQVLDKNSLIQANLTYANNAGFLADPYKWALVDNVYLRDSRPGSREQYGVLLRYVRNFEELNSAALHLDYRFYSDTWGVDSHTLEVSWFQPLAYGWQLRPRIRYYTQTSADFYQPIYQTARLDGNYSSDYRLAGFGAIAGGIQLNKEFFDRLRLAGGVDFYERQKGLGLSGGAGTKLDNFSYSMYSFSLNLKF